MKTRFEIKMPSQSKIAVELVKYLSENAGYIPNQELPEILAAKVGLNNDQLHAKGSRGEPRWPKAISMAVSSLYNLKPYRLVEKQNNEKGAPLRRTPALANLVQLPNWQDLLIKSIRELNQARQELVRDKKRKTRPINKPLSSLSPNKVTETKPQKMFDEKILQVAVDLATEGKFEAAGRVLSKCTCKQ